MVLLFLSESLKVPSASQAPCASLRFSDVPGCSLRFATVLYSSVPCSEVRKGAFRFATIR